MVCEVHRENESCSVIAVPLVPPSDTEVRLLGPAVQMTCKCTVCSEAEVNCNISISFIQPEIFIRVLRIVKQVLQFVSNNRLAPCERYVGEINVDDFTGRRSSRGEITTNVECPVDVVNHDFNLTVVVVVRRSKSTAVLVIFSKIGGHCWINGLIPC